VTANTVASALAPAMARRSEANSATFFMLSSLMNYAGRMMAGGR